MHVDFVLAVALMRLVDFPLTSGVGMRGRFSQFLPPYAL